MSEASSSPGDEAPSEPPVRQFMRRRGEPSHEFISQHNDINASNAPQDELDEVPDLTIPAAGRGNANHGDAWVNPSPKQLYRALKRRDKPIAKGDAKSVSHVHNVVTEQTWNCIMEYEVLHPECSSPKLASFKGMDGIYSFKARAFNFLGIVDLPFDRHDWIVDRCGKDVRYVIDYYAVTDDEDGAESFFIDARPAPTPAGLLDRARLAFSKWRRGEKPF